jgi:ATP-dependent helicase YprA (DUF1998 family)
MDTICVEAFLQQVVTPRNCRVVPRRYLKPRVRVRLAGDIVRDHPDLTAPQVARALGVDVKAVHARTFRAFPGDRLIAAWQAAGPLDRARFAERVGVGRLWDECIEPALG